MLLVTMVGSSIVAAVRVDLTNETGRAGTSNLYVPQIVSFVLTGLATTCGGVWERINSGRALISATI